MVARVHQGLTFICICCCAMALPVECFAVGEYSVQTTTTLVSPDTWTFDYMVTNNNQGTGPGTGLDDFSILVPTNAVLVNETPPPSFSPGGDWQQYPGLNPSGVVNWPAGLGSAVTPPAGYAWFSWWGYNPESLYPIGKTAEFSVTFSNVAKGSNIGAAVTYLIDYPDYRVYSLGVLTSPAAVPEPGTLAMLLAGLGTLAFITNRRRRSP